MITDNPAGFELDISGIVEQIMSEKQLKDHGFEHVKRVVWYGKMIMETEHIEPSEDILAALYCHDIGRIDDSKDDEHGKRSVTVFEDKIYSFFNHLDFATISFAIENHQSYTRPLVWQYDTSDINATVPIVLWDADRLDLPRIEKFRGKINTQYLHTAFAKNFANTAEHLEIYSHLY